MIRLAPCLVAFVALLAAIGRAEAGPALLFEATTGKVLYAEDMDQQWHPASLTKIMTAYIAFQDLKAGRITLETKIKCSEEAHKEPPSKVGLPVGAEMSMDMALKSLIVKSANDVAVMIAEALGPTMPAFIERMNRTAAKLGMTRTRFFNPHGLPASQQVTTARDLAKLARAVVIEFPEYAHYWSLERFQIGKLTLATHNGLLRSFEGADGLKTGFICDSGFNVIASASREGLRIMAVVLGEPSSSERNIRAASLLEHGFQKYGWKMLFSTSTIDNMPLDAEAGGPRSVRHTITSFSCGNRGVARNLRAVKIRAKQKQKQTPAARVPPPAKRAAAPGTGSPAGQPN